jgi:hypothetical protein
MSFSVSTPIHWEAVLLTAIPATLTLVGVIVTSIIASRAAKIGQANKEHLISIDKAVNGVEEGAPTLREQVDQISSTVVGSHDNPTKGAPHE